MDEILNANMKQLYNKIVYLYDMHGIRVNEDTIYSYIMVDLKKAVIKRINSDVLEETSNVYKKITLFSETVTDDKVIKADTTDSIKKFLNDLDHLTIKLELAFMTLRKKLVNLSFELEYSDILKYFIKNNYAFDYDFIEDFKMLFRNAENNFYLEIRNDLKRKLQAVEIDCKNKMNDAKRYYENLLKQVESKNIDTEETNISKNENINNDGLESFSVENELSSVETKENFINAREEQRKKDSIEREKQLNTRKEEQFLITNNIEETQRRKK